MRGDDEPYRSGHVPTRIRILVEGRPRPQGSKRHVGNGRMIESSRIGSWRQAVREQADEMSRRVGWVPLDVPHTVTIAVCIPPPKKAKRPWPGRGYGDIDKHVRAILDALTGPVLADDADVEWISAWKTFRLPAGADITVERYIT